MPLLYYIPLFAEITSGKLRIFENEAIEKEPVF